MGQTELLEQYEFDLDDSSTWRNFTAPPVDRALLEAIEAVDTVEFKGQKLPRYRAVWGGELTVPLPEMPATANFPAGKALKYLLTLWPNYADNDAELLNPKNIVGYQWRNENTGYVYSDLTGKHHVLMLESVPAELRLKNEYELAFHYVKERRLIPPVAKLVVPILREPEQIGQPRWIIEQHRTKEEVERARQGEEVENLISEPGYYHFHTWQDAPFNPITGLGKYLRLDEPYLEMSITTFVEAAWYYERNATPGERKARLDEQRAGEVAAQQKNQDAIWNEEELKDDMRRTWEQVKNMANLAISDEDLMKKARRYFEKRMEQSL